MCERPCTHDDEHWCLRVFVQAELSSSRNSSSEERREAELEEAMQTIELESETGDGAALPRTTRHTPHCTTDATCLYAARTPLSMVYPRTPAPACLLAAARDGGVAGGEGEVLRTSACAYACVRVRAVAGGELQALLEVQQLRASNEKDTRSRSVFRRKKKKGTSTAELKYGDGADVSEQV